MESFVLIRCFRICSVWMISLSKAFKIWKLINAYTLIDMPQKERRLMLLFGLYLPVCTGKSDFTNTTIFCLPYCRMYQQLIKIPSISCIMYFCTVSGFQCVCNASLFQCCSYWILSQTMNYHNHNRQSLHVKNTRINTIINTWNNRDKHTKYTKTIHQGASLWLTAKLLLLVKWNRY